MTVRELIEQLSELDPDLHVFTDGYEGGYHYAEVSTKVDTFCLRVNEEWYYGPHERVSSIHDSIRHEYEQVKGIVL